MSAEVSIPVPAHLAAHLQTFARQRQITLAEALERIIANRFKDGCEECWRTVHVVSEGPGHG